MQSVLDKSPILIGASEDKRQLLTEAYLKKYEDSYARYSRGHTSHQLITIMVNMYDELGVKLPYKLLDDIKYLLAKGIVLRTTFVYDYLPLYKQIVKLYMPLYDTDVEPKLFYTFTISETVYGRAIQYYNIKDKYTNAFSVWYIERLVAKGIKPSHSDLIFLIEHAPWDCVEYIIKHNIIDIPLNNAIAAAVKADNIRAIMYLMKNYDCVRYVVECINKYNNSKLATYLGPLTGNMDDFIDKRDKYILIRLAELCPLTVSKNMPIILENRWFTAVPVIVDLIDIDINFLHMIMPYCEVLNFIHAVKATYNKLVDRYGIAYVLNGAASKMTFDDFMIVYELNTVDLSAYIDLSVINSIDIAIFCIREGCKVTKEIILKAIAARTCYKVIEYYLSIYASMDDSFMTQAIKYNNLTMVKDLREAGYSLKLTYPGIATRNNSKEVCMWLVQQGCPIHIDDVRYMPEELKLIEKSVYMIKK